MHYEVRQRGTIVGRIKRSVDGAWYAKLEMPGAIRSIRAGTLRNAKRMAAEAVQWHSAPQRGLMYLPPAPDGSVTFHKR